MTEKTTIALDRRVRVNDATFFESAKCDPSGGKILSVHATARAVGYEALADEFRVRVKTNFYWLVLSSDNKISVKEESVENTRSISQKGVIGSTKAVFCANLISCSVNENSFDATAEISLGGYYVLKTQADALSPDDDLFTKKTTVNIKKSDYLYSALNLTESNEMRMPIRSILDTTVSATADDVERTEGGIRISGETTVRIVAITDNEQFLTQNFSRPFSADVIADCPDDATFDVGVDLTDYRTTLSDGDARVFLTDMTLKIAVLVSEPSETEVSTDCYSIKNETTPVLSTASFDSGFCTRTLSDKTSATMETGGVINELFACLFPEVVSAKVEAGDGLTVEGVLKTTVLYSDENNAPAVKRVEIPYSVRYNGEYPCTADLYPETVIKTVAARLKTGSEAEITAEFSVTVRGCDKTEFTYLSDVTVGEEKLSDDVAICLYPVKPGEDLFDVAKALGCREETLLKLNPEIALPLQGGEKILLYNELTLPEA